MRNNKTILILAIVLFVFIGAKLALTWFSSRNSENDTYKSWWGKITPDSIVSLSIDKDNQKVTLEKQTNKNWKVNGDYPAVTDDISNWLTKLITPSTTEIVAESVTQYERLGIATNSATLTLKTSNNQEKHITIGAATMEGRYIKLESQDPIYLIKDLPSSLDSSQLSDWIDKTIAKVDQNSIKKITWGTLVKNKVQDFSIEKKDSDWIDKSGKKLDTANINPMLMDLQSLIVTGLLNEPQLKDIPIDPTFTVTIDRNGQDQLKLNFYETKTIKAITVSDLKGTYILSDSIYQTFNLKQSDFKFK